MYTLIFVHNFNFCNFFHPKYITPSSVRHTDLNWTTTQRSEINNRQHQQTTVTFTTSKMMLSQTTVLLATVVIAIVQFTSGHDVNESIRHSHVHQSRELWGFDSQWSWSNLMFHLGVCHADSDCPNEHPTPGPLHCGCPDCTKPHPPHFQNSYCENLASTSDSETEETSEEAVTTETSDSTSSRGQSSRSSNWLWLAAVGAAVGMVGAAVYAQRKRSQSLDERSMPLNAAEDDVNGTDKFGVAAASAAFGAVLMKMGLKKDTNDSDTDDDNKSVGSAKSSVSARKSLVERGLRVPSVYQDDITPNFIPIPKDASNPNISQTTEGLEVGQYRPSGVRGNTTGGPSTPCMV